MIFNEAGMISQPNILPGEVELCSGEVRGLLQQLGCPVSDFSIADNFPDSVGINSQVELVEFLQNYQSRILVPIELPAIFRAYQHAAHNECRELLALDRELSANPVLQRFSAASQHIGRLHLKRLRPLRDDKVVQRYLRAIEAGEAQAWHTPVYGLTLAIFSLPLRQGLAAYAWQTVNGFIQASGSRLPLNDEATRSAVDNWCAAAKSKIESLLPTTPSPFAVV